MVYFETIFYPETQPELFCIFNVIIFFSRWILFSHHHWLEPMKYSSLNQMLWTLEQKWKTGALSQREVQHVLMINTPA